RAELAAQPAAPPVTSGPVERSRVVRIVPAIVSLVFECPPGLARFLHQLGLVLQAGRRESARFLRERFRANQLEGPLGLRGQPSLGLEAGEGGQVLFSSVQVALSEVAEAQIKPGRGLSGGAGYGSLEDLDR